MSQNKRRKTEPESLALEDISIAKSGEEKSALKTTSSQRREKGPLSSSSSSSPSSSLSSSRPLPAETISSTVAAISDQEFHQLVNKDFTAEPLMSSLIQLYSDEKPFPHIQLFDFFDRTFLESLRDELSTLEFSLKSNDLYEFFQTNSLKSIQHLPVLNKFRSLIYSQQFRQWISSISGIQHLNDNVDMFAAIYQQNHYLLCHDDELEGRRIAFILYLVDDEWTEDDGGGLSLFNTDRDCQPSNIHKTLVPKFNSFAFFNVSLNSFHQVNQVHCDRGRFSISGWFYGEPIVRPPPIILPQAPFLRPIVSNISQGDLKLEHFIKASYLEAKRRKRIKREFSDQSYIELPDFLLPEVFDQLSKALYDDDIPASSLLWKLIGPPNKQLYQQLHLSETEGSPSPSLPHPIVQQLFDLFRNQEFFHYLQDITTLDLELGRGEVRRFDNGHYAMMHDEDPSIQSAHLDVNLSLLPKSIDLSENNGLWDEDNWGGFVAYSDGDEVLQLTPPISNCLTITYRDRGLLKFVKMVTLKSPCPRIDFDFCFLEEDLGDVDNDDDDENDHRHDGGGDGDDVDDSKESEEEDLNNEK